MRRLAPIALSTYGRVNHLKQTVDSLSKNTLASESELYVFSDAPQAGDEDKVSDVRNYLKTVDGFKNVYIIERTINDRVMNNRGGMKQLLEHHGRIIFLEEDVVTAPGFLMFMNDGLDYYEDNQRILSITGYCPPIDIPESYNQDIFILQRFSAWGFATWRDKFDPFGFDVRQHGVDEVLFNKDRIKEFTRNGVDMYHMLRAEYNQELDALDVKLMFYEFVSNMFTVYPSKSLVQNIGHDGSGINCVDSDRFHHDALWGKEDGFIFNNDIQVDEYIRNENYWFRSMDYKHNTLAGYVRKLKKLVTRKPGK